MPDSLNLSKEQLRIFSGEHLYYEIVMLYGVTHLLQRGVRDLLIYNALLESFVIHSSVILDFFYKLPLNLDEAKAVHYIKDREDWKKALPPYNKYFIKFNKKRNSEVMHLSYRRLAVLPFDKKWNSSKLVKDIGKIVDLFLDHADPDLIDPRLYELKSKGH